MRGVRRLSAETCDVNKPVTRRVTRMYQGWHPDKIICPLEDVLWRTSCKKVRTYEDLERWTTGHMQTTAKNPFCYVLLCVCRSIELHLHLSATQHRYYKNVRFWSGMYHIGTILGLLYSCSSYSKNSPFGISRFGR